MKKLLLLHFLTVSQEILKFIHKLMNVFELAIDRGETDIGHSVQPVKLLHHLFPDFRALNLPLPFFLKMEFHAVDDLLDDVDADGSLFTRLFQAIKNLEAIEGFPSTILFDDRWKGLFGPLARGKPFMAAEALSSPSNRLLVLALTRIDDFAFRMITERAFHNLNAVCIERGSRNLAFHF